ncbi:unnamed protein product [Peniophora sp. CBMAI 1063]|nr:unnamed protein product [Peniophora sp. CBMAI 1063]
MAFDSELDALFRTSAKTAPPASPIAGPSTSASNPSGTQKKRKNDTDDSRKAKKTKSTTLPAAEVDAPRAGVKKTSKKRATASIDSDSDSDDNADVEEAYAARTITKLTAPSTSADKSDSDSDRSDSDDADAPPPVHESLLPKIERRDRGKKKDKTRYVPPGETKEQRDARTVFVGNVPVEVVKSKSGKKQLERHIISLVPSSKIESTRFRSVAFATPTGLTTSDPSSTAPSTSAEKEKDTRAHGSARAAHWRDEQDKEGTGPERKKLTPAEKKRIAFIKQEVHDQASAVHAYIVFAHTDPSHPSHATALDPYEAAQQAIANVDGTSFLGRTLRVDAVAKEAKEKRSDPRRTVFVGNLDFATKDEDLRVYFEGVVSAERGPPGVEGSGSDDEDSDEDEDEGEKGGEKAVKPKTWVRHVRVVRDKDTQLGKGFAYIEFADRECVDELLALEEGKLKFAKRKLRLQRCKTLPGSAPLKKPDPKNKPAPPVRVGKPTDSGYQPRLSTSNTKRPISLADLPKGDPRLGERLKDLDKSARKAVKAADAERVARRMAKKKARAALGLKVKEGDKEGKKRVRERKNPIERKAEGKKNAGVKKGRVRSEKSSSVARRNAKK